MEKDKFAECLRMMRKIVSDIQGAPYPGEKIEPELYAIWYEHVQKAGSECLEYLDANFPLEQSDISKTLDKFFS